MLEPLTFPLPLIIVRGGANPIFRKHAPLPAFDSTPGVGDRQPAPMARSLLIEASTAPRTANMSDPSSDSVNEPKDEAAPVADGGAVAGPIDFSGSSLGLEKHFAASAQDMVALSCERGDEPTAADLSEPLAAKIASISFGDRVFFLPSEEEAWRYAIETIRRYHRLVGRPKRRRLVVCAGASGGARGLPPGLEGDGEVVLLQTDDPIALTTEIDNRTAAILITPVRTKSGFEVVPGRLLARLRETADEYGLALVYDESACGFGRSGMFWAHEWTGVTPDVMVALHRRGDASSLATVIVTQKMARGAPERPLLVEGAALRSGRAAVDALMSRGFLERAQNRSWRLEDRLLELFYKRRGAFTALSGIGLMQGLECPEEAEPMRARLAECGLLTRAMGSFLGLFPGLAVAESEIDAAVSIIDSVCARET